MTSSPNLTENDIRPDHLMAEAHKIHAQDIQHYLQGRSQFVVVPCPACQHEAFTLTLQKDGIDFVTCNQCGTMYENPRPTVAFLADYYAHSEAYRYWNQYIYPAAEQKRREHIFRPRALRTLDLCRQYGIPTDTLLEVGAGFGIYCEEIKMLGAFKRVIAVEPVPELAESCRKRGVEVYETAIEQVDLGDTAVNVVALFEVLEHLFSPRDLLKQAARLLTENGLLIVTCPNVRGFEVQMLQEKSTTIDVEHLNYFHPESLRYLAEACGFEVLDVLTPGKLDVDIVRKAAQAGQLTLENQPFLHQLLLQSNETVHTAFQTFLADHRLSTHMWLVGLKR